MNKGRFLYEEKLKDKLISLTKEIYLYGNPISIIIKKPTQIEWVFFI